MSTKKDLRKTYKNHEIKLEGNVIHFDGKYDPITKTLKVYRYHGDITLRDQAFQDFAIENGIIKVLIM